MPRFRKKPIEVEAVSVYDLRTQPMSTLPQWVQDAVQRDVIRFTLAAVEVETREGVMTVQRGGWIVQGVQGELYPVARDIFEATFIPVEEVARA